MDKIRIRYFIVAITVIFSLTACTLPGFSTPTPFSFPTPDKTMTALFEPTQEAPATSAAIIPEDPVKQTESAKKTSDAEKELTETLKPTITETPVPETEVPTATTDPTEEYVGPEVRSGPSITAGYLKNKPGIDGDLYEWNEPIQKVINYVVYGADKHSGELDCSGTVVAGWDETYLYLGFRVKDDKYVQEAVKEKLYLGDSIEILFDRYVSADYYLQAMTSDDYQIGISPGKGGILSTCSINTGKVASMSLIHTATPCPGPCTATPTPCTANPPQAYVWAPKTKAGKTTEIKIGALESGKGYQVELKIPWSLLGVSNPSAGDHYGFAVSISDNDKTGKLEQQTMVSNVPTRYYADPTTWGDLYLK